MDFGVAGFEWDKGNRDKCQKHGVPLAVFPDLAHSATEERFKAIGRIGNGRGALIVFTLRRRDDDTSIRPVSARYMHRKEVEHYEEEAARAEKR